MPKTVLIIVYYFPPMGSSGVQRPLKLVKYLERFGWTPVVIAPEPGLYSHFDESLQTELNETQIKVHRVKADTPFDKLPRTGKGTGIIPDKLAAPLRLISNFFYLPDNKTGWIKPALAKAAEVIRNTKIDLIWSTAPPYSNHLIAAALKKEFGIPAVMDFRDDWSDSHLLRYPTSFHRRKMLRIEQECLKHADLITAINRPMLDSLKRRNSESNARFEIIPQGYDPADFDFDSVSEPDLTPASSSPREKKMTFLYNGLFYGENRPDVFLQAVKQIIDKNPEMASKLSLVFQGELQPENKKLIQQLGLENLVTARGYLPHKQALRGLSEADVLWFTVGHRKSSAQVTTGKLFEYIGTGKPILGLIPQEGEAADILRSYKAGFAVDHQDVSAAADAIRELYEKWNSGSLPAPDPEIMRKYDRIHIAENAARLFSDTAESNSSQQQPS